MPFQGLGVDFRDDKRDIGPHTKVRAVVYDDRTAPHGFRAEGDGRALLAFGAGEKSDVYTLECFGRRGLDRILAPLHCQRPFAPGQDAHLAGRKMMLGQDAQHFFPDHARADNGDVVFRHNSFSSSLRQVTSPTTPADR